LKGRVEQLFCHLLAVWVFKKELKSIQGIAEKKGLRKEKEDLAIKSAISLPR